MSFTEQIITIAMVVFGTQFTRWFAFFLVPSDRPTPVYIRYLGKVLPSAVFAMLVVYSYRSMDLFQGSEAIAQIIAGLVVIGLQIWRKNMLLSIGLGTIFYMFLVQYIFV